jgi:hypothetical protein
LELHVKGFGDPQQGRQGGNDLFIFDLGKERLGETGGIGKSLQRHAPFLADAADFKTDLQLPDFLAKAIHKLTLSWRRTLLIQL